MEPRNSSIARTRRRYTAPGLPRVSTLHETLRALRSISGMAVGVLRVQSWLGRAVQLRDPGFSPAAVGSGAHDRPRISADRAGTKRGPPAGGCVHERAEIDHSR